MLVRNIPLVVLLVLLGMLFWPTERAADQEEAAEADFEFGKPNGARPPAASDLHRAAL
jgi:hypothetical protein